MILIGELLNSTRKKVRAALEARDACAMNYITLHRAGRLEETT